MKMALAVDTAVTVPVNIAPLIDDTDFKTIEDAVAYNAAGLTLVWNFVTSAGVQTQTAVTPTNTGGNYDWSHKGNGMYNIEIPASGGASINNDTEGYGWFSGKATGVLPWVSPIITFGPATVINSLVNGSDTLQVDATQVLGTALTEGASGRLAGGIVKWFNVASPTGTVNSIPDAVAGSASGLAIVGSAMTLASSAIQAIWDAATSALTTVGSIGKLLADSIPTIATDVWAAGTRVLTAGTNIVLAKGVGITGFNDLSAAQVNTEVDTALVDIGLDHLVAATVTGTDIVDNSIIARLVSSSATADWDTYVQTTDSLQAIRDRGDAAWITATGFSTHSAADVWSVATRVLTAATNISGPIADQVWEEAIADHSGTAGSTAEALNAAGSAGDPWVTSLPGAYGAGSAGFILGTYLTGNAFTRLGAPAGASVSADIAAIKAETALIVADTNELQTDWVNGGRLDLIIDAILVDTAEIGVAGAGLTNVPWNPAWDPEVQSECQDAIQVYHLHQLVVGQFTISNPGSATTTVFNTDLTAANDAYNDQVVKITSGALIGQVRPILDYAQTDGQITLAEPLTGIPANGVTAVLISQHVHPVTQIQSGLATSAEVAAVSGNVWAEATRTLTAGTNIVLAKGTGITGFNDLSAAQVNSEVDTALTDIHLDHLLATDYDPASKPGVATALLNELIESDAGVSRFTANALEQGPSGGGGVADWTADERTAIRAILGIPASGTTPDDPTIGILDTIRDLVVTVDSVVDSILVDTTQIGLAGAGLSNIPYNPSWDADIQSEVEDALRVYGLDHLLAASVTGTDIIDDSIIARLVSSSATADWDTYVNTTDSLQALRDRGDAAWLTATGFSTHSASDVWAVATRVLTAGTNIVLAKGTGITGFNDLSAAQVNAEVDTALVDIHLDHLLAADYDPASKPGVATALLNELIESDAGVSRYTANALEQGPSGGGGVADWTADERTAIRSILGIPASGTTPDDPSVGILDTIRDLVVTGNTNVSALITTVGVAGAGLTNVPYNASWDAQIQSEVEDALVVYGLDHLVAAAVVGADIVDNSIIAKLASSSATADWDSFVNTTDSLQAIRDRGDAAWITGAGGGGGSGARSVTITVDDGTNPLQNATVRVTQGAESYSGLTDVSGVIVFSLDDATWTVSITKPGYSFTPVSLVVNGTETQTYSMTETGIPSSSSAPLSTGYLYAYGIDGQVAANVAFTCYMLKGPGSDAQGHDITKFTITSNSAGLVSYGGFIRGATYRIQRGKGDEVQFLVPNTASFELPEVLGRL